MFDDPALEAVGAYWRARDEWERMKRAEKAAWLAKQKGDAPAYCRSVIGVENALAVLGSTVPTTPRGAIEILTVALSELKPFSSDGYVGTRLNGVDKLEIIRRVRDALEGWC